MFHTDSGYGGEQVPLQFMCRPGCGSASRCSYKECAGQDAGQRCISQSHQVLREGLPPAIPEGVHKNFIVLDGNGADSGVQVEGSPAPPITL